METISADLATQWPNWEIKMVGYPGAAVPHVVVAVLSVGRCLCSARYLSGVSWGLMVIHRDRDWGPVPTDEMPEITVCPTPRGEAIITPCVTTDLPCPLATFESTSLPAGCPTTTRQPATASNPTPQSTKLDSATNPDLRTRRRSHLRSEWQLAVFGLVLSAPVCGYSAKTRSFSLFR